MTKTVGDVVDERGPCLLMARVIALAEAHGRMPVGWWHLDLGAGWTLTVNGTPQTRDRVPPWNAVVSTGGLPVVMFDAADGRALGADGEEAALDALDRALKVARGSEERD